MLRRICWRVGTGAMPDIRHCCSLFVFPIVETPQHQQNATFHWPTARLLLEGRTVTFAVSFLSIQHKQIRIRIIFCFTKKRRMGREKCGYRSKWNTNSAYKLEKYVRRRYALFSMSQASFISYQFTLLRYCNTSQLCHQEKQ